MTINKRLVCLLLPLACLGLCNSALQAAEATRAAPTPPPTTTKATKNSTPVPAAVTPTSNSAGDKATAGTSTAASANKDESFIPSTQISEDLSVSFPADI